MLLLLGSMNTLLLSVMLLAGPRAPADAELAYFIPRLEAAGELVPFLDAAGEHSVLLRRESWRSEVHPLLRVDVTRKDSLVEAGLDPSGSGTLSYRGSLTFSCVAVADSRKFEAACAERLKTLGTVWRKEVDGASVVGTKDPLGRVLAGYVLKGKESCAIAGQGSTVEKPLLELGKLLGKAPSSAMWKTAAALPGQAFVVAPEAAVGLKGAGLTLTEEFKSGRLPIAKLTGGGSSPYAGAPYDAMVWVRLRLEPSQLSPVLGQLVAMLARTCPACDRAALTDTATALAPTLSGNALLFVEQVKIGGSLRSYAGRLFAHKGAVLAEAADPKAARLALENLARIKGAKVSDEGYGLQLHEGELRIGVRGNHLYLSDDPAALDSVFKALPASAGKQAHGAEYGADPERIAKGLAQVPVVDVLAVPELAALLAISAEGGPLLLASEKLTGYADSETSGAVRGQLVWTLRK
jgi:hypothetical protein